MCMDRRTGLITTASIAGVIIAGAAVIGANIRILDSASAQQVGELSATTVPVSTLPTLPDAPPGAGIDGDPLTVEIPRSESEDLNDDDGHEDDHGDADDEHRSGEHDHEEEEHEGGDDDD